MRADAATDVDLRWSNASVDALHDWFDDQYQSNKCLEAAPPGQADNADDVYQAVCGNGIVELAEECDAGGNTEVDPCCNALTCQLTAGAACSSLDACCTDTCQVAAAGVVCRSSQGTCDVAEECNGDDAFCPTDLTVSNGQGCQTGVPDFPSGVCSGGHCLNPDAYCFSLYGAKLNQGDGDFAHRDTANECADFWCLQNSPSGGFQFLRLSGAPEGIACADNSGICRDMVCVTDAADFPIAQWTVTSWSACGSDSRQSLGVACTNEAGATLDTSACSHLPQELFSRTRSCSTGAGTGVATTSPALSTTSTALAGDPSGSSGASDAAVIGGAVGAVVAVALALGAFILLRRGKSPSLNTKTHPSVLGAPMAEHFVVVNPAFTP